MLACYAVRAWGHHARQRSGWRWFGLGVVLAAFACDALRLVWTQLRESPSHALAWPCLAGVVLLVAWVARGEWRRIGGRN